MEMPWEPQNRGSQSPGCRFTELRLLQELIMYIDEAHTDASLDEIRTMIFLNPDFELHTFYWFYAKSDSSGPKTVVTYTAVLYDTRDQMMQNDTQQSPYMIFECKPLEGTVFWHMIAQDTECTVESRVIEAFKKHFSYQFMFSDGVILTAEYAQDAADENCRLHSHPDYGQAIFGSDLEEAHDNS